MDTTQKNPGTSGQSRPRQSTKKSAQQRPRQTKSALTAQRRGAEEAAAQPRRREAGAAPRKSAAAGTARRSSAAKTAQPRKKATAARTPETRQVGLPDSVSNKKRAYGNSKPKKKSALSNLSDMLKAAKKKAASQPKKQTGKKRIQTPKQPTPAVIYTQPQPFNRNRLLIQLMSITAVVLAVVMGLSVFFKVEVITVSGADVYSAYAIREASGIDEGENLLTFSRARAAGQIKANLPYVEKVRIGIKLPNTVNIMIEEADVVYAIKSDDGTWWLINSNGRVVEQSNGATAAGYTQVLGVTLYNPTPNERAVATEDAPAETAAEGETVVPVTVTGAQRLSAALQILQALEANDIVGEAASVNVSSTEEIILWYGTRYQVNLGDTSKLDYKITCMNDVVLRMSDYQSGILDISFKQWTSQVGYTPFE